MAVDWQVVAVAATAIGGAVAAVVTGVYTGKNGRARDESEAEIKREEARQAREIAEEIASKARIEAIASDAIAARKRLREAEDEFDIKVRDLRRDRDKGWALASYYFGIMGTLAHLLNNIFQMDQEGVAPERLQNVVRNSRSRMKEIRIPVTMDDPIPENAK